MSLPTSKICCADVIDGLRQLDDESVQCVVTSPPYWNLRDYGIEGQLGLEKTPEEFIEKMVAIFREVRRVLRDDGTVWLNLGDSYATHGGCKESKHSHNFRSAEVAEREGIYRAKPYGKQIGLKEKDLCGVPWRVALALQADGWYLRSDIIWSKPNPMPESVTDRPTKAHEYLFLLTKKPKYYYDADAIREPHKQSSIDRDKAGWTAAFKGRHTSPNEKRPHSDDHEGFCNPSGRNKRTVWTIPTQSYSEAHFATFPEKLVEPCILAGTSAKGCCPKCGAGWVRVVEKSGGTTGTSWHDHSDDLGAGTSQQGKSELEKKGGEYQIKQLGWQPSCDCGGEPIPCTVCDIFMGSGTTGLVALKHKRSFIGIELNPEYVKLAEDRIAKAVTGVPAKEARVGQMALFEGPK